MNPLQDMEMCWPRGPEMETVGAARLGNHVDEFFGFDVTGKGNILARAGRKK